MASLTLQNIKKAYGDTVVLRGVNAEAEDGEYLVLVGPSGCGKSTLLRCIAGLEEITQGDLHIGKRRVNDVSPRDRNVAMVFQSYALYPHMTVAENMSFALRVRNEPPDVIEREVSRAAEMLELAPLLNRLPAQLSGGQRQRVAMGRAIVRRPDIFLFDEPLSNLDAALRTHMRVELKRLHRELGTTVVHVTHDQVEALTLADRIMVLEAGVVQQFGTPRQLFDTPANQFVATFIGAPAMNLFPEGDGVMGVRPTDVVLTETGESARVDVVESMGAEALVHLHCRGQRVVAQVREPVSVRPGDDVCVSFTQTHHFDAKGLRVE
jgi:multiple sugar transport system ATP-binding protein